MRGPRLLLFVIFSALVFFLAGGSVFAASDGYYNLTEVAADWDGTTADRLQAESPDYMFNYGDRENVTFPLPWTFSFYGTTYTQIFANSSGNIWFVGPVVVDSFNLPSIGPVISAWNTDLNSYFHGGVFVQHKTSPERVVIQWQTETFYDAGYGQDNSFEVVLFQDGSIRFDYKSFSTNAAGDFGSGISKGDGVNYLSITDGFGDVPTLAGRSFRIAPDLTPPTLSVNPVSSPTLTSSQTLSGSMEDGAMVAVSADTAANVGAVSYPTATTWECPVSSLAEGDNTFTVTASDLAGNMTTASPAPVITYHADTDGDLMPDYWETSYGLDPAVNDATVDADGDGVSNYDEYVAGTVPNVVDTDGDGINDGSDPYPLDPPALTFSSTSIDADEKVDVTVSASYLAAPGSEVRIEQVVDLNGNGLVDAGEPLVRSFSLTDGTASAIPNVQGDEDGGADGFVTTTLGNFNVLDLYHAPADYAFRVTAGSASTEKGFTVTPVTQLQSIAGTVTDGTNPVAGAFVQLVDKWQRPVAWAVSDTLGQYQVEVKVAGDYIVKPLAYGYATANSSTLAINLTAGQNVSNADLVLVPGTYHVTGRLQDSFSLEGIDGVWIVAEGADSYSVAMTDADGNYDMLLPAGSYELWVEADTGPSPANKGYLGMDPFYAIPIDLTQDLSGVDLGLHTHDKVFSGRVVDEYGLGIAGLPVVGSWDPARSTPEAFTVTDADGNYSLAADNPFSYFIHLEEKGAQSLGYIGDTNQFNFNAATAPPDGHDFSVRKVNAWIDGTVKESDGNALEEIVIKAESLDGTYYSFMKTASDGSYRFGLPSGDWVLTTYPVPEWFNYIFLEQTVSLTQGQTAQVDFVKPVNTIVVEKALYDSNKQILTLQASSVYGVDADLKCNRLGGRPMSWIANKNYWEYVETTSAPPSTITVYGLEGELTVQVTTK